MDTPRARRTRTFGIDWPWALLGGLLATAFGFLAVGETALDNEFPAVVRPTFSRYPPAAYRLAEPGDTLDRVAVYLAAGAIAVSAVAAARSRSRGWVATAAASALAFWYSANPSPTFDGWHGWNFQAVANPNAPAALRAALVAGAALAAVVAAWGWAPAFRRTAWAELRGRRVAGLVVVALALTAVRLAEWPNPEPAGFWPRWAWVIGLTAWAVVVGRVARQNVAAEPGMGRSRRLSAFGAAGLVWAVLTAIGLTTVWHHRPLGRLRAVDPGKVYISAMPTYEGLKVAHARHGFKTIINLFPERTKFRSPLVDEERRFAAEHGIRLIENPHVDDRADGFVDDTLRVAQDPSAWPVLVHCHACMDRTPAWMGMYRFLVQGAPLADVFREIEQHRGCRPKSSVTLLYTHFLPSRSNGRFDADPTGRLLRGVSGEALKIFAELRPSPDPVPVVGARPGDGPSR